jgi:hypothetical protein
LTTSELAEELRNVLPENHPLIEKVESLNKPDYQVMALVADLVDRVEDWKRGIRGWNEVEEHLAFVKDEVEGVVK